MDDDDDGAGGGEDDGIWEGTFIFFSPKREERSRQTFLENAPHTSPPPAVLGFFGGKNKEKSYETVYKENVPEKPLRIHHDKLSSIISVAMMGIFP
jgi:hypothetical protein